MLALHDAAERRHQLDRRRVLEQIADRSRLHGVEQQLGVGERGQHHDAEIGQRGADRTSGVDAALPGELDVHQDQVGRQPAERLGVDGAGVPVPDAPEIGLRVEALDQPVAEDRMILDHDDADAGGCHARIVPPGRRGPSMRTHPDSVLESRKTPRSGDRRGMSSAGIERSRGVVRCKPP